MEEGDADVFSQVLVNGNELKRRGWGIQGHFTLLHVVNDKATWVFSLNNIRPPVMGKLYMLNFDGCKISVAMYPSRSASTLSSLVVTLARLKFYKHLLHCHITLLRISLTATTHATTKAVPVFFDNSVRPSWPPSTPPPSPACAGTYSHPIHHPYSRRRLKSNTLPHTIYPSPPHRPGSRMYASCERNIFHDASVWRVCRLGRVAARRHPTTCHSLARGSRAPLR